MRTTTALLALGLVLLGCPKKEEATSPSAPPQASGPDAGAVTPVAPAEAGAVPSLDGGRAETESELACVDRWLRDRGLDEFGNAAGTMYAGGTPLFDERTGESKDRLAYVYQRQPEAKKACAAGGP